MESRFLFLLHMLSGLDAPALRLDIVEFNEQEQQSYCAEDSTGNDKSVCLLFIFWNVRNKKTCKEKDRGNSQEN